MGQSIQATLTTAERGVLDEFVAWADQPENDGHGLLNDTAFVVQCIMDRSAAAPNTSTSRGARTANG